MLAAMSASYCFCFLFLLFGIPLHSNGEDFHPERTRLMDFYPPASPVNFLFRGNMPVINGSMAYMELNATMASLIRKKGIVAPTNFTLIVVSYLNIFEEKDLKVEEDFFKTYPSKGFFKNIVVVGNEVPPPQENDTLVKELIEFYETDISYDDLPKLTKTLRDMLTQKLDRPAFIYTHCEAGTDRTGEVSGAYYIRYLQMSFQEALYVDNHIQNRDMYKVSRNALQWYCYYLHYKENFTNLNCTLPSRPDDTVRVITPLASLE